MAKPGPPNQEYVRSRRRQYQKTKSRHGFSRDFLDEKLVEQDFTCALSLAGACHGDLVVDHCHVTGGFRGWLCRQHNAALGKLGDSVDNLKRVVRYLGK